MKKIFSFAVIFCLLLFCVPLSTACAPPHPLMNLTIKNYSDYEELSIGYIEESTSPSASPQGNTLSMQVMNSETFANTGKKKVGLIGKHKDGYYKQLEFEEKQESDVIKHHYGLFGYMDVGPFLFLSYSIDSDGTNPRVGLRYGPYNERYTLLMDKASGKIFDVTNDNIWLYDGANYYYTTNAVIGWTSYNGLCKYTVENKMLKRETILEAPLNDFNPLIMVDRFGNIYIPSRDNNYTYMITNKGQIKTILGASFAPNDIMYVGNQCFNENGELEEATFVPTDFTNLKFKHHQGDLDSNPIQLYQENNTYYYHDTQTNSNVIAKYTFFNDIEYSIDYIQLEKFVSNFNSIHIGKKLYFLSGTEIYYIDILSGKATTLVSDYFFNALYLNEVGDLVFDGLDSYLNKIKGTINPDDDSIQLGVTKKEKSIFFRTAIN